MRLKTCLVLLIGLILAITASTRAELIMTLGTPPPSGGGGQVVPIGGLNLYGGHTDTAAWGNVYGREVRPINANVQFNIYSSGIGGGKGLTEGLPESEIFRFTTDFWSELVPATTADETQLPFRTEIDYTINELSLNGNIYVFHTPLDIRGSSSATYINTVYNVGTPYEYLFTEGGLQANLNVMGDNVRIGSVNPYVYQFEDHIYDRTTITAGVRIGGTFTAMAVPEPTTVALMGLGSIAAIAEKRRQQKKKQVNKIS